MADASYTAADIKPLNRDTLRIIRRIANVALAHGLFVCQTSTEDEVAHTDADAEATAYHLGIVFAHEPNETNDTTVAADEAVDVAGFGTIMTGFSGLTTGQVLYLSTTSGRICTYGDLSTGDYVCEAARCLNDTDLEILPGAAPLTTKA